MIDAIKIAIAGYLTTKGSVDSSNEAFRKMQSICYVRKAERDNPAWGQARYIKNILGKRFSINTYKARQIIDHVTDLLNNNVPFEQIKRDAATARSLYSFLENN